MKQLIWTFWIIKLHLHVYCYISCTHFNLLILLNRLFYLTFWFEFQYIKIWAWRVKIDFKRNFFYYHGNRSFNTPAVPIGTVPIATRAAIQVLFQLKGANCVVIRQCDAEIYYPTGHYLQRETLRWVPRVASTNNSPNKFSLRERMQTGGCWMLEIQLSNRNAKWQREELDGRDCLPLHWPPSAIYHERRDGVQEKLSGALFSSISQTGSNLCTEMRWIHNATATEWFTTFASTN